MFPLDVSNLGVLAVVWSAARNVEDAVPIAAAALARLPSPPRVSSVELGNIFFKILLSHQWAIEVSVSTTSLRVVESSEVVCAKCGNLLRPHSHLTVDAFTFASGRLPVKHTVMACFACSIDFHCVGTCHSAVQQSHCSQTPMRTSISQFWHDRSKHLLRSLPLTCCDL